MSVLHAGQAVEAQRLYSSSCTNDVVCMCKSYLNCYAGYGCMPLNFRHEADVTLVPIVRNYNDYRHLPLAHGFVTLTILVSSKYTAQRQA